MHQPSVSQPQDRPSTRIKLGQYFADIFADKTSSSTIFHWMIQRSSEAGTIMLGEQSTYDGARREAEHHLARLAGEDVLVKQLHRSAGA